MIDQARGFTHLSHQRHPQTHQILPNHQPNHHHHHLHHHPQQQQLPSQTQQQLRLPPHYDNGNRFQTTPGGDGPPFNYHHQVYQESNFVNHQKSSRMNELGHWEAHHFYPSEPQQQQQYSGGSQQWERPYYATSSSSFPRAYPHPSTQLKQLPTTTAAAATSTKQQQHQPKLSNRSISPSTATKDLVYDLPPTPYSNNPPTPYAPPTPSSSFSLVTDSSFNQSSSIPADHLPPTPYSTDLHSPHSDTSEYNKLQNNYEYYNEQPLSSDRHYDLSFSPLDSSTSAASSISSASSSQLEFDSHSSSKPSDHRLDLVSAQEAGGGGVPLYELISSALDSAEQETGNACERDNQDCHGVGHAPLGLAPTTTSASTNEEAEVPLPLSARLVECRGTQESSARRHEGRRGKATFLGTPARDRERQQLSYDPKNLDECLESSMAEMTAALGRSTKRGAESPGDSPPRKMVRIQFSAGRCQDNGHSQEPQQQQQQQQNGRPLSPSKSDLRSRAGGDARGRYESEKEEKPKSNGDENRCCPQMNLDDLGGKPDDDDSCQLEYPFIALDELEDELASEIDTLVTQRLATLSATTSNLDRPRVEIDIRLSLTVGQERRHHRRTLCYDGKTRFQSPGKKPSFMKRDRLSEPTTTTTSSPARGCRQTQFIGEHHLPSQSQETGIFIFQCPRCPARFPLTADRELLQEIVQHVAVGFHQPKPTTSEFFRYFKQKFKLVVSKSSMLVTGNTVFQCNLCSQEFDVDSVKAMSSHVLGHHSPPTPFCFFCEKRVSDLDLHLHDDESEQLHELRLRGLATVGCKSEVNALKQDAFCSNCTNRFHSDPGLPDWLATISCRKCMWSVVSAIRPKMVTQAKRVLVSCSFCHHNKFGHHLPKTAKLSGLSSICTNCFVLLNSFLAESGEECEKYVRGMLNELVKRLMGESEDKTKAKKQVAVVTPERREKERQSKQSNNKTDNILADFLSKNYPNLLGYHIVVPDSSPTDLNTKCMDDNNVFNNIINNNNDTSRFRLECHNCNTGWNAISRESLASFSDHVLGPNLFQSRLFTKPTSVLALHDTSQAKVNKVLSVIKVVQCQYCSEIIPTSNLDQVCEHVKSCGSQPTANCVLCGKKTKKCKKTCHQVGDSSCMRQLTSMLKCRTTNSCKICRGDLKSLPFFKTQTSSNLCLDCVDHCKLGQVDNIEKRQNKIPRKCVICDEASAKRVKFHRQSMVYDVSFCLECWSNVRSNSLLHKSSANAKILASSLSQLMMSAQI